MKFWKKSLPAILLAVCLAGCGLSNPLESAPIRIEETGGSQPAPSEASSPEYSLSPEDWKQISFPDPDGYYYDLENVVLYLDAYGTLPPNYITNGIRSPFYCRKVFKSQQFHENLHYFRGVIEALICTVLWR